MCMARNKGSKTFITFDKEHLMGTNFFLFTKDKSICEKLGLNYSLTDIPDFGYEIHIAKTSCGWLPLFQAHSGIRSLQDLKRIYASGKFKIFDEYWKCYDWYNFSKRVIEWNGGVAGVAPLVPFIQDSSSELYDANMPDHIPVSHFDYKDKSYAKYYFKDDEGYEFMELDFS